MLDRTIILNPVSINKMWKKKNKMNNKIKIKIKIKREIKDKRKIKDKKDFDLRNNNWLNIDNKF